jgi:hypothetical protein
MFCPTFAFKIVHDIMVDFAKCDAKLLGHYVGKDDAAGFLAYHRQKLLLDLAS